VLFFWVVFAIKRLDGERCFAAKMTSIYDDLAIELGIWGAGIGSWRGGLEYEG
jgi:hypothetical protein